MERKSYKSSSSSASPALSQSRSVEPSPALSQSRSVEPSSDVPDASGWSVADVVQYFSSIGFANDAHVFQDQVQFTYHVVILS